MKPETKKGWRLLSAPFIFSILLLAAPITMMFLLSFWTQDYLVLDRTFTLNNYIEAATQPVYQLLFTRSLLISLTATFFTVLLAFPMAMGNAKSTVKNVAVKEIKSDLVKSN